MQQTITLNHQRLAYLQKGTPTNYTFPSPWDLPHHLKIEWDQFRGNFFLQIQYHIHGTGTSKKLTQANYELTLEKNSDRILTITADEVFHKDSLVAELREITRKLRPSAVNPLLEVLAREL